LVRILFVGAGATGGYFGGELAAAGKDVTFLVRPARAAQLAERGLRIRTPDGETVVRPRLITADAVAGPFDLIVLAVKAYAIEGAMADLAPAVGPRTVIVPLLNGMRHVDTLVARFGAERVYGGVCMIAGTLTPDGDVVRMTGMRRLGFGPLGGTDDRLDAVAAALSGADFPADPSTTIMQDMWEKWVLLASLGAVTTLMRATVADVLDAPGGPAFAAGIGDEALAIAAGAGYPARDGAAQLLRAGIGTPGVPTTSSMYRDMAAGLPVEADEILGDFVAYAGKHGVPAPLLGAAYTSLAIYAANRLGGARD
jgi:2-dehydropantoate 2-reductase